MVDDDDFNNFINDDPLIKDGDEGEDVVELGQTFSLMQESDNPNLNVFAPAYIRPVYDGGGNKAFNTSDIPFDLNVFSTPEDVGEVPSQLNLGRNSGPNESDDFWVVYIQIGYQGRTDADHDPLGEDAQGGVTAPIFSAADDTPGCANMPQGADGSLVYVETSRDSDSHPTDPSDLRIRVAPHEVGHQFGLFGDAPGFWIMTVDINEPLRFVPPHVNILRCRVRSPGQP